MENYNISEKQFRKIGATTYLSPIPAVVLGCADPEHGHKPNLITIAWAGVVCSKPPMISVSIRKSRLSHEIISNTGEFTLNLIGRELCKDVVDDVHIVVVAAEDIGSQHDIELAVVEDTGFSEIVNNILFIMITDVGDGERVGLFGDADDAVDVSAGEAAGAPLLKDVEVLRVGHRPMDHHGGHEALGTCKAADFVVDLVIICCKGGTVIVLIGAVGEFALGVEREFEPIFVGLELGFIIFGEIRQSEVFVVIILKEEVQEEFAVVFVMDLFQTAEKHLIKDGCGLVFCDPTHEKDAVVKEKVAAFEGSLIPHDGQGQSSFTEVVSGGGGDLVDPVGQPHGG